jgi:hypothetical protein
MTTVGTLALGMMGRLRPKPVTGDAASTISLPPVDRTGGLPVMATLARRHSSREFAADPLPLPVLSALLWAAYGVNRPDGGRTAPSAINAQEVDDAALDLVFVADYSRAGLVPVSMRESYASVAAGAIAQNVEALTRPRRS